MAAVEHAQLHQFERPHVGDELRAGGFEWRPAGRKTVLDHPLGEGLGHDRPGIDRAGHLLHHRPVGIGRRRNDPVDHGRGKGDFAGDVVGEPTVAQRGKAGDDARGRLAVCRQDCRSKAR